MIITKDDLILVARPEDRMNVIRADQGGSDLIRAPSSSIRSLEERIFSGSSLSSAHHLLLLSAIPVVCFFFPLSPPSICFHYPLSSSPPPIIIIIIFPSRPFFILPRSCPLPFPPSSSSAPSSPPIDLGMSCGGTGTSGRWMGWKRRTEEEEEGEGPEQTPAAGADG